MPTDWCVIDVSYLCWRAYHTTGGLSHNGEATGIVFGFLRDLPLLADRFSTDRFAFAFDRPPYHRSTAFPGYKRREYTDEELAAKDEMRSQLDRLRTTYLPELGYENVYSSPGYEADDVMAAIVAGLRDDERAILVAGDQDLYQLLSVAAAVYHPVKDELVTAKSFRAKWGLTPADWVRVKALAGCDGDKIPGCKGVAEPTAVKYLRGETKPHHKVHQALERFRADGGEEFNTKLVRLPWPGLKPISLLYEPPRPAGAWNALCDKLGMVSLRVADRTEGVEWERS